MRRTIRITIIDVSKTPPTTAPMIISKVNVEYRCIRKEVKIKFM